MHTRLLVRLPLFLLACAFSQENPDTTIRITVNLVQVDAVVTDAKNRQVTDLKASDFEIRQVIDILMRRRQNNPILTGEAGVGKTAVVEGFALRVAQGDVPPPLQNVTESIRVESCRAANSAELIQLT